MRNKQTMTNQAITKIGIVVFDGIIPFHLSVPYAVFEKVLSPQGSAACQISVCTSTPGQLQTSAGFSMIVDNGLDELADKDIVIVPSWDDPFRRPDNQLINALHLAHSNGATIIGLCMGAFVLASAGLLDGKTATTHWQWAQDFKDMFPLVLLNEKVLYIDNGDVITSAGTAASIDCCLHLVRQRWGISTANAVARQLVVAPYRQGGQAQYIDIPVHNNRKSDLLTSAMTWATDNLNQTITLDTMAEKACMSRRHFTRCFQKAVGYPFSQWLVNQRLILAQHYLETTEQPIDKISDIAGFSSPLSLRRYFKQQFHVSPSDYRRTFQGEPYFPSK